MFLTDSQKLGVALSVFGFALIVLGVLLMFDAGLIAIGNVLFIVGVPLIIGMKKTLVFFSRKNKLRGSICFFIGFFLIFAKYTILGMVIEGFGFVNLFGNFFPLALSFMLKIPVIGDMLRLPGIKQFVERVADRSTQYPV